MTTEERRNVRQALLLAGFRREYDWTEPNHYDHGDGVYTEVFRATKDRTKVTIEWDKKTDQ
jgi:hypothetical protein